MTTRIRTEILRILFYERARWFTPARIRFHMPEMRPAPEDIAAALIWLADNGYITRRLNHDLSTPANAIHDFRITDAGFEKAASDLD